jgi:hypothetical protein
MAQAEGGQTIKSEALNLNPSFIKKKKKQIN